MKTILAITSLAAFNLAAAQKTTELKDFKSLTIGEDMHVNLVKSNQNKVVTNDIEESELEIEIKGGMLTLKGDDNNVTLYYKDALESVTAASDSEIIGTDEIKTASFSITAASDAKVALKLNVKKLTTTANSDAVVTLTGSAGEHDATFSSDAVFNGQELLTENTSIVLSSDASGVITAKGTVNATVSSDGSLKIYGNPKKVNQTKGSDAQIVVVQ